jgi:3-isopropylmalate/(R)-2-methylmalate dehydratase large subunit
LLPYVSDEARAQVEALQQNCARHGIKLHGWNSAERGIVHIIGPELGATQPGMVVVCGDSHTSTHGAFGSFALAIGTSEVGHVLASQCILQRKPANMEIIVDGPLGKGVSAKDVILHIISQIGVDGATGMVIEYRGSTIAAMDMDERMTLCNMSIECGAKAGLVAPDEVTTDFIKGRKLAPRGAQWDQAVRRWLQLRSDPDARFDHSVSISAEEIVPSISYGTNPAMVIPVSGRIPDEGSEQSEALNYMNFHVGKSLLGQVVDLVFIGSCGSQTVKRQAEELGLHRIFADAGAEWRNPGCSMCIAMNGDFAQPGQYVVSTSNRNFVGRQGTGARTLLASPLTAAVCAITGSISDPVKFLERGHA